MIEILRTSRYLPPSEVLNNGQIMLMLREDENTTLGYFILYIGI